MKQKLIFILALCIGFSTIAPQSTAQTKNDYVDFKIIYTNDNHGWLEPYPGTGGAAGMYTHWKKNEKYNPNDSKFLVMSGGDLMTGPAISTWYNGESMIEVLNAMNFDLAAVGNHEFDLGPDGLREKSKTMKFPLLAANINEKSTGKLADFVKPYEILEVAGLKVAVIGLATLATVTTTFPKNVKDYDFVPYLDALNKYIGEVESKNPDIIFILAHFGFFEAKDLVPFAKEHKIPVIFNGHYHEKYVYQVNDIYLIQAGCYMQSYVSVPVRFNKTTKEVYISNINIYNNTPIKPDKKIQAIVSKWQERAEKDLTKPLGYCKERIRMENPALCRLMARAWVDKFGGDVAFNNIGGVRQDVEAGNIDMRQLIGLMPFDNHIATLELTGQQVLDAFNGPERIYCYGLKKVDEKYILKNGSELDLNKTYKVVTTDYLVSVTPAFKAGKNINYTEEQYRQPVIELLQKTSQSKPLNDFLD